MSAPRRPRVANAPARSERSPAISRRGWSPVMGRVIVVVVTLVGALVLCGGGAARSSLVRSTVDRPDDIGGPQIHVVYVLPSDGTDRALDTDGTLAASTANWETWLRGQTGGHGLRLDTYQGAVDVTFFRMSETEAQLTATGLSIRDAIERELKAAGLTQPDKLYAAYYDGISDFACGGGAWPPTLPGIVGALYIPSTFWNTVGDPCYVPASSQAGLQLMDLAMLHELLHTMGFVATCAPHSYGGGHVSDSPTDLMYAGTQEWHPSVLDFGRDDYFDAHIPGCADLADSPYLEGNDPFKLTVSVVSTGGQGSTISNPPGIDCPSACVAGFDRSSTVTLTAYPAAGSRFAGWSGACAGSASTCRVTMDAAKSTSATFAGADQGSTGQSANTQGGANPSAPARTRATLHAAAAGSRLVKVGHTVGFTIHWQNSGRAAATSVVVCARLPGQMILVAARGAASLTRRACWRRSSVAPGARLSFTFVARVNGRPATGSAATVTTATATNAAPVRARAAVRVRA